MSSSVAYDRVKFATTSAGTGALTVGAAATGYATPAGRSVPDQAIVDYTIEDSNGNSEVGTGVYTVSGTSLSRDAAAVNVVSGTAGTGPITLSGNAIVFFTVRAQNFNYLDGYAGARIFAR